MKSSKHMKLVVGLIALQLVATTAEAARCKDYRNCRQAVKNWCAGNHPRADGDKDGIPCENVCRSKAQVDKIRAEIGC